jgi:hypothetical protein
MVNQDGICPSLLERDISGPLDWLDQEMNGRAGLRVNPLLRIQITVLRKRGQLGARPNIVRQREYHVWNDAMVCLIRSLRMHRSWHILLEAAINYWSSRSTRVKSMSTWTYRVTHLRGWKPNEDEYTCIVDSSASGKLLEICPRANWIWSTSGLIWIWSIMV